MTVYNAQDLTPDVIISLFLYGQPSPPADLVSESLIRPTSTTTTIEVDMASYFASAGRFAKPSMSPLMQQFFLSTDPQLAGTGVRQEFTAAQLSSMLGTSANFSFQQFNYDDAAHDRAARTLIYNSVGLRFSDATRFVIEADGTRHVINMSLVARPDDYNFVSDSTAANAFNPLVQAWTDPSGTIYNGQVYGGLGRTVDIKYVNASSVPVISNYTLADYAADSGYLSAHYISLASVPDDLALIGEVAAIANDLFYEGITYFLDDKDRPVLYGTDAGETVAALQVDSRALVYDYLRNGVQIFGGKGDDELRGTRYDDKLHGGADKDILQGFLGDDTLSGDAANDFLDGGDGTDTAEYLDVTGNISIRKLAASDVPIGIDPNASPVYEFAFLREGTGEADRLRDVESVSFGDDDQRVLIEGEMKVGDARMLIDTGDGLDVVDFSKLAEGAKTRPQQVEGKEYVVSDGLGAGFRNVEVFLGTSVDDEIATGDRDQKLYGGDGDDFLAGGAGDDLLDGGAGFNVIETGSGDDKVVVGSYDFDPGWRRRRQALHTALDDYRR